MKSMNLPSEGFEVRQVLEAEREAKEAIATARLEAEQSLEQARVVARAVEQRAVEATQKIQQVARQFGEQRLRSLERETQHLLERARQEHPEATIDALARQLAWELVSLDPSDEPDAPPTGGRNS